MAIPLTDVERWIAAEVDAGREIWAENTAQQLGIPLWRASVAHGGDWQHYRRPESAPAPARPRCQRCNAQAYYDLDDLTHAMVVQCFSCGPQYGRREATAADNPRPADRQRWREPSHAGAKI